MSLNIQVTLSGVISCPAPAFSKYPPIEALAGSTKLFIASICSFHNPVFDIGTGKYMSSNAEANPLRLPDNAALS